MRKTAYRGKIVWALLSLALLFIGGLFGVSLYYPLRYEQEIITACDNQGIDPFLVYGVIRAESRFRPDVVSSAGAIGLMQVTPDTGHWIAERLGVVDFTAADLYRPEINIEFGVWYLRYLLDRFGGDLDSALLAYNAGPRAVDRWAAGEGTVYPETLSYLYVVQRAEKAYRFMYSLPIISWFLRLLSLLS